jgi:hypothetical protein
MRVLRAQYVQKRLEQVRYELSVRGVGVESKGQQESAAEPADTVMGEDEDAKAVVSRAEFTIVREKIESYDAARDKVREKRESEFRGERGQFVPFRR